MNDTSVSSKKRGAVGRILVAVAIIVVVAAVAGAGALVARQGGSGRAEAASSGTSMGPGHSHGAAVAHDHPAADASDHDDGAGAGHSHPTSSGSSGAHGHGRDFDTVWEDATRAEQQGANELIEATEAAAAKYADVSNALADGFRPNRNQQGVGLVHYPNMTNRRDSSVLDPNRLEGLVYYQTADGQTVLVGALYTASGGPLPPAPGGDITMWHSHTPGCAHPAEASGCEDDVRMYMLHVWLVDGVDDPFADNFRAAVGDRAAT